MLFNRANKITATMALELAANEGFAMNGRRGAGHVFDSRALERFLSANKLAMVLRAHELHQHGFMVSVLLPHENAQSHNQRCTMERSLPYLLFPVHHSLHNF